MSENEPKKKDNGTISTGEVANTGVDIFGELVVATNVTGNKKKNPGVTRGEKITPKKTPPLSHEW